MDILFNFAERLRQLSKVMLLAAGLLLAVCAAPCFSQESAPHNFSGFDMDPGQMAEMFLARGQFEQAQKAYKNLIESGSAKSEMFRGLVKSCEGRQRLDDCVGYLSKYTSKYPESSPGWYGLGFVNYLKGRGGEAEKFFMKAAALDPENSLAFNNWAAVLAEKQSFSQAIEKAEKAISLDPLRTMFYFNLKKIYEAGEDRGRFEKEYREYLARPDKTRATGYGKVLARSYRQKGFGLYNQGRIGDSLSSLEKMTEIYREIGHTPGLVAGLFSRALLLEESGQENQALELYRKILEINPNHIQARQKVEAWDKKNQ